MIVQYLNGGLANQVFQYIFARYVELAGGQPVFLDDSFFFVNDVHNGYELEKVFGVKPKLLSRYFDEDVWQELIKNKKNGISIPQSFLDMGMEIKMVTETTNYVDHNPFNGKIYRLETNRFYSDIYKLEGDIYIHGYWINKDWLETYRTVLLKELAFPALTGENLELAEKMTESESVALHVRRGDYVSLNLGMGADYYHQAAEGIAGKHQGAVFFVFSDDIAWCRENAEALGLHFAEEVVYVEGNVSGKNYIDLQLMTYCKGMILSNSAFCYLAALMSDRLSYYINPVPFREI